MSPSIIQFRLVGCGWSRHSRSPTPIALKLPDPFAPGQLMACGLVVVSDWFSHQMALRYD